MNKIDAIDKRVREETAAEVLADLLFLSREILETNIERLQRPAWSRIHEARHARAILKEAHEFLTR